MKNEIKMRGKSIARRLNAAILRRSFAKTVIIDIIAAAAIFCTWCFTVEQNYDYVRISQRGFETSSADFVYNTVDFVRQIPEVCQFVVNGQSPEFDLTLPFDGVYYKFDVTYRESDTVNITENHKVVDPPILMVTEHVMEDASGVLTVVTLGTILLMILQALSVVVRTLLGGGMIKQYLRPIDDIAVMAEQISRETYGSRNEKSNVEKNGNCDEQNETVLDLKDVENLADAIDGIADSRARIEVQASELGGLEAAINNMLKRLEESRRGQIRFVDDASHELRTPIAVIQGYANMLDRWGKEDPEIRDEAIAAIKNESEHMKILLDQLLFLARGEMDRHAMKVENLSVNLLLDEIAEESKMLDSEHSYEIITSANGDNDALSIDADYAMIKQCIRILCDNSAKYTPSGGSITLKAEERVSADDGGNVKKEVCIEVADNGIGISADELPRIFDRFYRGERARSDNTGGSGLGLSIARWITEQHHGRIEAISSPGIGTKMTLIIPQRTE